MDLLRHSVRVTLGPAKPLRQAIFPFIRECVAMTAVSIILCIPWFAVTFGQASILTVVAVGALPRSMSVGKQLRSTVLNLSGACVASVYAIIVAAILNSSSLIYSAISRWAALTIFVLLSTLLRARFQELAIAQVLACVDVTLLLFTNVNTGVKLDQTIVLLRLTLITFSIAEAIALITTCGIMPTIASREYKKAIAAELQCLSGILEKTELLLGAQVDEVRDQETHQQNFASLNAAIAQSRGSMSAIQQWQIESTLEFGTPFWRAPQANQVLKVLYGTATTIHSTATFGIEQVQRAQTSVVPISTTSAPAKPPSPSRNLSSGAGASVQSQEFAGSPLIFDEGAIFVIPESSVVSQPESPTASSAGHNDDVVAPENDGRPDEANISVETTGEVSGEAGTMLFGRIGECAMTLLQGAEARLQMMRSVVLKKRNDDFSHGVDFEGMKQTIADLARIVHSELDPAISLTPRSMKQYFIVSNLIELTSQLETLDTAIIDLLGPRQPRGLCGFFRTTALWNFFTTFNTKRRDDLRHDILTNKGVANIDEPDTNAIFGGHFWGFFEMLNSNEMRFAVKVTVAFAIVLLIAIFVAPAHDLQFIWTLFALLFSASPIMGGNVVNTIYRVIATIIGCSYAVGAFYASTLNPYALAALSLPVVFVAAYTKSWTPHPRLGGQIMISYAVIAFAVYGYTLAHVPSPPPAIYAVERFGNIVVGVLIVLVVFRLLFPYVARTELRKRLGTTMEDLLLLYTHTLTLFADPAALPSSPEEAQTRLDLLDTAILLVQTDIYKATTLLSYTLNEPKLRHGPFDYPLFQKFIGLTQHVLDLLIIAKNLVVRSASPISAEQLQYFRAHIITPLNEERRENHANIAMVFYVLASALEHKRRLPYHLPRPASASSLIIQHLSEIIARQATGTEAAESSQLVLYYFGYVSAVHLMTLDLARAIPMVRQIVGVHDTLSTPQQHIQ